jgi:hypothetical protein
MNQKRILNIVLGIFVILCFWMIGSGEKWIYDNMNSLLKSNRNLDASQNITVLEWLRENRTEEVIKFMEVRAAAGLKYDGIKESIVTRAKDYQSKYCKTVCLGVQ